MPTKQLKALFDDTELRKEIGDEKMDKLIEEVKHFEKTHRPRCQVCKINWVHDKGKDGKVDKYSWKPKCKHTPGLRLLIA